MAEPELRTALIVAVPEAASTVDAWRERTAYAKPSNGIPAHMTILFPFVPLQSIDDRLVEDLGSLFGAFSPFTFELRAARRFPGVLYLAPEPAAPFVAMVEAVSAAYPDFPPYEGTVDSIVPHLTVAEGDADLLDDAEVHVEPQLPLSAEVREVLLMAEVVPEGRWETKARLSLGRDAES